MNLGFIGTGTIAAAIIEGLQLNSADYDIVVSPRNAEVAAKLTERFANVRVAATNQEVLDVSDTVVLALRPQIAHDVLVSLQFRPDQHVVSLIPAVSLEYLRSVTTPARNVTRAVPLPSAAYREAPTSVYPPDPEIKALFDQVGIAIELENENEFDVFTAATSIMSSYFAFADTTTAWMERQGVSHEKAHTFMSQMLKGLSAATTVAPNQTFAQLVEEHQTRGGLNEQVFKAISVDGKFVELDRALDGVLARVLAGKESGKIDLIKKLDSIEQLAEAIVVASGRNRGLVNRTRVEEISDLASGSDVRLYAKLENEQETGSFKLRGATNKILSMSLEDRALGVVTASNGNHGLGFALAAKKTNTAAEVFVSNTVAPERAARIEALGAKVTRAGAQALEAEKAARVHAGETGRIFVSPYNDLQVIIGQGTTAVELLEQLPSIDAVFITVGGGGLISGMGAYLKQASPQTEVVGCWPENSRVLYESLNAGRIIEYDEQPTLSDSSSGGIEEGSVTFEIAQSVIDTKVLVSEEEILETIRMVQRERGWLIEGAAAVALAAFKKTSARYAGKTVAILFCGGNVSEWIRRKI